MKIDRNLLSKQNISINSRELNLFFKDALTNNLSNKHELPRRLEDLIKVIIFFNFIDRLKIYRKFEDLTIEIPVYEPSFWEDNEIYGALNNILWTFYKRDFDIQFVKEVGRRKTIKQSKLREDNPKPLLLFSEGLDSVAAATQYKNATLVHVVKSTYPEQYFKQLKDNLFPKRLCKKITYRPTTKTYLDTGVSNSRGLIFLGLASIHLELEKADTLISGENGVMIYNPPLFEGSQTTKTMNLSFIKEFEHILTKLYERDIKIKTPYKNKTKKEVVSIAYKNLKKKFQFALQNTHSCFSQQPSNRGMCGRCYACILRQMSIIPLLGHDPSTYSGNPFIERYHDGKGAVMISDLIRFSRGVLENKLPYEAYVIVKENRDLFHRFANESLETISKVESKSKQLDYEIN